MPEPKNRPEKNRKEPMSEVKFLTKFAFFPIAASLTLLILAGSARIILDILAKYHIF